MVFNLLSLLITWLTLILTGVLVWLAFETLSAASREKILKVLFNIIRFWQFFEGDRQQEEECRRQETAALSQSPQYNKTQQTHEPAPYYLSQVQQSKRDPNRYRVLLQVPVRTARDADLNYRQIDEYRNKIGAKYGGAAATALASLGVFLVLTEEATGRTEAIDMVEVLNTDIEKMQDAMIADFLSPLAEGWSEPFNEWSDDDLDEDDDFEPGDDF